MPTYKNPGSIEFDASIQRNTEVGNSSSFIDFPYSVEELYGVKGRVPVNVRFEDIPYQGSLVRMGPGPHKLLILNDIQAELNKRRLDSVHVRVELDTSVRKIALAPDARSAVEHAGLGEYFDGLAYTHQREYHLWIESAKRPETRGDRIAKMVTMLRDKHDNNNGSST